MPKMSGVEMGRIIRDEKLAEDATLILISGCVEIDEETNRIFSAHITKPFSEDQVEEIINQHGKKISNRKEIAA